MSKVSSNRKIVNLFWRYSMRYPRYFWFGSIGAVLAVIAQGIVPPFVVAKAFAVLQHAYSTHTTLHFATLAPYFIAYTVTMLLGVLFWRIQAYSIWELEINVRRDMALDVFDHLQQQSQRFHADRFGGALVSQTNKFMGGYERLTDTFIWNIIPGVTTLIFSLGVLVFVSYRYAIVLAAISVIYLVLMAWRMKKQMPYNHAEAIAETAQTAALADDITNMSTIRSFAAEEYEYDRFNKVSTHLQKKYHELSVENHKNEIISHIQTNSFNIIAFLFGLVAITELNANVGVLYLILSYTGGLVNQLWQFGRMIRDINRGLGDSHEMVEILDIEPEVKDPVVPETSRIERGGIEFRDVTFGYHEDQQNHLFNHLSLRIDPGEKIGLVGHSGGGKTTVTKLILRLMDIQDGQILIDGQDISKLNQSDLRSHIAYVAQEPMLFHRNLSENIAYGDKRASQAKIEEYARLAHADEFIKNLPHGYDTLVGERGVKLSGGQRQRVAIARAMLKNAPILVLDEATSALDSESEKLIQDALWKLMEGRTAIVVAHRLSTIQKMDRIIVLDDGKITEQGTHKELIAKKGIYAELWGHQSGGFLED